MMERSVRRKGRQNSPQVNTTAKIDELFNLRAMLVFVGVKGRLFGLKIGDSLCNEGQRQPVVCMGLQASEIHHFDVDGLAPVTHAFTTCEAIGMR